jgi:hypothetical protein
VVRSVGGSVGGDASGGGEHDTSIKKEKIQVMQCWRDRLVVLLMVLSLDTSMKKKEEKEGAGSASVGGDASDGGLNFVGIHH